MIKEYDTGELRIDFTERMKGLEAPLVKMATFDAETFVINGHGWELRGDKPATESLATAE